MTDTKWLSEEERQWFNAAVPDSMWRLRIAVLFARLAAERERNAELMEAIANIELNITRGIDGYDWDAISGSQLLCSDALAKNGGKP